MKASVSYFRSGRTAGIVFGICAASATGIATPADAANDASTSVALEEVVVTALRRSQTLHDVPASVSVLDGNSLGAQGAQDYKDYLASVPGVNYSEVGYRGSRAVIRGVSDGFASTDPLTGFYIDEAPVSQTGAPTFDPNLYDVERVEVLKGPQGTLYGSGSMGGTVRVMMRKPRMNAFEGAAEGTYGAIAHGGSLYRLDGVLNTPIVDDLAAFRLVGSYRDQDGFIDNIDPSAAGREDINSVEKKNARGQLLVTPGARTSVLLSFMYQEEELGGSGYSDHALPRYQQSRTYLESGPSEASLSSLTVSHDFEYATLTSATNYLDRSTTQNVDATNSFRRIVGLLTGIPIGPEYGLGVRTLEDYSVFSEELRIQSSSDSALQWLAGAFYSEQSSKSNQTFDPSQAAPLAAQFSGPQLYQSRSDITTRQLAAFGELTYQFNERLSATTGVRAFEFKQRNRNDGAGLLNGGTDPTTTTRARSSSETLKFLLDYKLTPDHHIYMQATEGFRGGGPNDEIPQSLCGEDLALLGYSSMPSQYESDSLWNYEIGSKNILLDNRLTINGALYYIDWKDIQSSVALPSCLFDFTTNGGEAVSKGAELEISVQPSSRWNVSAAVAYTDATITRAAPGTGISDGDLLPLVSELSWALRTDYQFPVTAGLTGTVHADVSRVGSRWSQFASMSPFSQLMPSYVMTNIRAGLAGDKWSAAVYATNLFDKYIVNYTASFAAPYDVLGLPRVIGVNVRYDF